MTDKAYRAYLESRNLTADGYTFMEMLAVSVSRESPTAALPSWGRACPFWRRAWRSARTLPR